MKRLFKLLMVIALITIIQTFPSCKKGERRPTSYIIEFENGFRVPATTTKIYSIGTVVCVSFTFDIPLGNINNWKIEETCKYDEDIIIDEDGKSIQYSKAKIVSQ